MRHHPPWSLSLLLVAVLAPPGLAEEARGPTDDDCKSCHDRVHTDGSIHADVAVACTECHADLAKVRGPHAKQAQAAQCGSCHEKAVKAYAGGIHRLARIDGKGPAATCASCHGPAHEILASGDRRSPTHTLNQIATCARCHDDPKLTAAVRLPGGVVEKYVDSIHGRGVKEAGLVVAPTCASCHGAHDVRKKDDPQNPVGRATQAATCGKCHEGILEKYTDSIHAKKVVAGEAKAPVCSDCHSAHGIQPSHAVSWELEVIGECGTCHAESLTSYRDTFHGHVTELGFTRMAKCADCHGAHDIAGKDDPRSRVAKANLLETCRTCHPSATASFVAYDPHANPADKKRSAPLYYTALLMKGLLAGVFGFFGLHTLLWMGRGFADKVRPPRLGGH